MINVGDLLRQRARLSPEREAYVDATSGERLSFAALNRRCNQAAHLLRDLGVRRGDRVALLLMNSAEFVELYYALGKIGAICVPLNWRLPAQELQPILRDSGAVGLIYGAEFPTTVADLASVDCEVTDIGFYLRVDCVADAPAASQADYLARRAASCPEEPTLEGGGGDPLFIMYTSGTTGRPKGVVQTHDSCFWSILTFSATQDLRDGDRYLAALPMFHVGSLTPLMLNIYRGITTVVMRSFDADAAWDLIERERITMALLVPAMLNFMIQSPRRALARFDSLRWLQAGAAPVPVKLIHDYWAIGIPIHQIYGLTESCGPACLIDAEHALLKVGSTGKAFFHTEVRVVDAHGRECAPREAGEIWIRGRHIMAGYWNQPDATGAALREGWLRTGDGGFIDEDGYVYVADRLKDMLISGGENIYPAEIENVLLAHAEVAEVAVIGQPSTRWGESPFAVVVPKTSTLSENDLLQFCDGRLAHYKRPCGVAFIDRIPRTPSGKILKRELRARFPGPAPH